MSGEANVVYWLQERGVDASQCRDLVKAIFARGKEAEAVLEEAEIATLCEAHGVTLGEVRPRALP